MNRTESLNRLLNSIYAQSVLPHTIIVVDGSDTPVEPHLVRHTEVGLVYVREFPPSLTRQRNAGIRAIPTELTHVGFLDDDLVLLPNSLEAMQKFISREGPTLGGAGLNIQDKPRGRLKFISVLMGHSSTIPGKICSSGYATSNIAAEKDYYSQWLCGGATIWRRDILQSYSFDEWYRGYALWEDVDFSYRVSKKFRLAVVAEAKVLHLHVNNMSSERAARIGDLEIVDRFYFVKKHISEMSMPMAIWASFGTIGRNFVAAISTMSVNPLVRAKYNLIALLRCVTGDIRRGF